MELNPSTSINFPCLEKALLNRPYPNSIAFASACVKTSHVRKHLYENTLPLTGSFS